MKKKNQFKMPVESRVEITVPDHEMYPSIIEGGSSLVHFVHIFKKGIYKLLMYGRDMSDGADSIFIGEAKGKYSLDHKNSSLVLELKKDLLIFNKLPDDYSAICRKMLDSLRKNNDFPENYCLRIQWHVEPEIEFIDDQECDFF